ncbi:LysR substrate-binding domain-containing protein [Xanthomonas nasturtii]|uniref:LysR substrate-binding domain-containing protein n=1 Tax=Xanthomonas TaxID=338 RepID=UPI000701B937|nr:MULTISPECIES: LysR substrate-binding domain-containing protein [Xanthomonas]KQR11546.1 transcriptional regulator [Xanthomonas sp. Leaf148]MEA9555821.1 LysR substrate-binding domain-containing protein [Xanthomonas nasturtii]MEA9564276.1 LysR substrate-binding domain-containing protein [Xanthomonas sp. WHRI 8932A]MEA9579209.1 LysR substrate-binding domain-containing protein [Xanthomonas nasturtii]MEA9588993.1 LysR substrate-binding domain-containing protein [Xanthomonas sp. WHRI 10064B]
MTMSSVFFEHRIKVRHLRVIEALDRQKSLLRASRVLNVTQPALTRALQEIEEIVGAPLFERHSRGVRPNAMGEVLVQTAHVVLGQLRRAQDTFEGLLQDDALTITVGALPVAASGLLPSVLAALYRAEPTLRVRLLHGRTDELLPKLAGNEVDLVVGRLYPLARYDALVRKVLYQDPIALVARSDHPLFANGPVRIAEAAAYRQVLPTLSQHVERDVAQVMREHGLATRDQLRSSSASFTREILLGTDSIAVMPSMMVAGDIARGELRAFQLQQPSQARAGGVIYRDSSAILKPGVRLLMRELEHQLALMAQQGAVWVDDQIGEHDILLDASA